MSTTAVLVKKLVKALLLAIISLVVATLANNLVVQLGRGLQLSIPGAGDCLSSHEQEMERCIIQPDKNATLDTVGGLASIKEQIRSDIIIPLRCHKTFFANKNCALQPPKGLLFCGPPGTGKTMLARAIAAEANVTFVCLSLSSIENKYYGETSKLLQAAFSLAAKRQPAIIFIDEIDGIARCRSEMDQSFVYGIKTELLSLIDGLKGNGSATKQDAVIVIGCTNTKKALDPAILRRLPRVYSIGLPNKEERLEILRLATQQERSIDEESILHIADAADGLSGSDLTELFKRASAMRLRKQLLSRTELRAAVHRNTDEAVSHLIPRIAPHEWRSAAQEMGIVVQHVQQENDCDCNNENEDESMPPILKNV